MHSTTDELVAVDSCTRVSLLSPDKTPPRSEVAGYYFGYDEKSRTWDLEKKLYERKGFKWAVVLALAGSLVGLTKLGFIL